MGDLIIDGVLQGGGVSEFLDLTDVDETAYTGESGSVVAVNAGEDALEFVASGTGDVTAAAALTNDLIVRGDTSSKAVQTTGITVDDSDNMSGMGTVDGRDVAADGAILDAIEPTADVTDSTNVNAAGAVMEVDFNAQTILAATTDDTPAALSITEQTLVGRLTGGNVAAIALGISDNNIVQIDGTANDTEWAIFNAAGLEGLTDAEAMAALSGDATAAFSFNNQALTSVGNIGCDEITLVDGYSINLQEAITFTGATTENKIEIPDALAVALDITESTTSYLKFKTTDGSELITASKKFLSVLNLYLSDEGGEYIVGDGTDLTIASGQDIHLTATTNINVPSGVGLTFGDDGEKISGDGTDLTITGNIINLNGTASVKLGSTLALNEQTVLIDAVLASDHTWTGPTQSVTAGENLTIGEIVYLKSDGKYWLADADAEATGGAAKLAMATASISADATGVVLLPSAWSFIRDDDTAEWTVTGIGDAMFLSATEGEITDTSPGAGDMVRIVGYMETATVLNFDVSKSWVEVSA